MTDTTLVILGATGDLTKRLLMPALFRLHQRGLTPHLHIIGYAIDKWDREHFLDHIHEALKSFAAKYSEADWKTFAERLDYVTGDLTADALKPLAERVAPQALFYLALPPPLFGTAAVAIGKAGLAQAPDKGWRRLVVEKPFGTDLASAEKLRQEMHGQWQEDQILRIDHFLGKETTQNLLVFRFANRFLEPVWNSGHIRQVQITYAETLGVEERAAYYDHAGALRDMLQNHLMQLFSLAAIEPLSSWDADILRNHKVEVLRSVKPITAANVHIHAARGQYTSGVMDGKKATGYRDEPGIAVGSNTETFAALRLEIDNWRWQGVPFYLRSGKRLCSNRSEIAVEFKPTAGALPGHIKPVNNWMIFRIKPHQAMTIKANAKLPGPDITGRMVRLQADYAIGDDKGFSAYEQLLMDALEGDRTHFLRFDEVEWAWRLLQPVLDAWKQGTPDFYAAGSEGPESQQRLMDSGHKWRTVRYPALEDNT